MPAYYVLELKNDKLSKILNKIGLTASWDRMFQKESNSPHFQYFSHKTSGEKVWFLIFMNHSKKL